MCKTQSIPEGLTIYEKDYVTFQELFTNLETTYNDEVTLVSAGNYFHYYSYLPENNQMQDYKLRLKICIKSYLSIWSEAGKIFK